MPAALSSPIGPAIGQLLGVARAQGRAGASVLPVLAVVPDPRARRGVRHRLGVILGLAVCAVLAGARSFTAIAEWAADADQATLDGLGVTGPVPCESTFRRVLQSLDADALDDAAGAWARQRTAPALGGRRLIAVYGKTLRGSAVAGRPGGICWPRWITLAASSWGRPMSRRRRMRSRCSRCDRARQHCRRPAPPRPPPWQATAHDHALLTVTTSPTPGHAPDRPLGISLRICCCQAVNAHINHFWPSMDRLWCASRMWGMSSPFHRRTFAVVCEWRAEPSCRECGRDSKRLAEPGLALGRPGVMRRRATAMWGSRAA